MGYRFEFRTYQRKFARPLITSHGHWHIRTGIILRLSDEIGGVGWGEIAPISWFGSETLEQAVDFCEQLPPEITESEIFSIPDRLPACQFGFESALGRWSDGVMRRWGDEVMGRWGNTKNNEDTKNYSGLLPAGEAALTVWENLWERGYGTFKWKIAVDTTAYELEIFHHLIQILPTSAKLRLDANGGLNYQEAQIWLENCDCINSHPQSSPEIEFIEQPLPVGELQSTLALSRDYQTVIALDESVATLNQLIDCYKQGWRGIFTIKPGIAGSPSRLRQFCQHHEIDTVFSSVMETAIGREVALQIAIELSTQPRAFGFGIDSWFTEDEETWLQDLWRHL